MRIPGLKMTVVQADGQNVQPVEVDEFRIGPGETYDVIVEPDDRAYTLFAEAMDRSGYTRGTLAPRPGMTAAIPPRRPRPLRTMADMGMEMPGMKGMDMAGARCPAWTSPPRQMPGWTCRQCTGAADDAAGQGHGDAAMRGRWTMAPMAAGPGLPGSPAVPHGPDTHGAGNSTVAMAARSRLDEPGSGFDGTESRVLVYADLKSLAPYPDRREPDARNRAAHHRQHGALHVVVRRQEVFGGQNADSLSLRRAAASGAGQRHDDGASRFTCTGCGWSWKTAPATYQPRKHTVSVKPAERLTVAITADAPGRWAMHCHLLLHMEMGMFRVVEVSPAPRETA